MTTQSVDCDCGGRHSHVPVILQKHRQTKRHINWEFNTLVAQFLSLTTQQEKVQSLKKQKVLYLTGKVV